ncbi:MAG: DoxX family protein [Gemmataceae bacterium]
MHTPPVPVSRIRFWFGMALSVLPGLLLLMAASMNIMQPADVVEKSKDMGYEQHTLLPLGVITIACVLLLLYPGTAMLGAVLITGYLGGAVATHVIHKDPLIQAVIPVIFAAVIWIGLCLRDPRIAKIAFARD